MHVTRGSAPIIVISFMPLPVKQEQEDYYYWHLQITPRLTKLWEKRRHARTRKRYEIIVGSATDTRECLLYHNYRGNDSAFPIEHLHSRASCTSIQGGIP